eukprot:scaffold19761_cov124-Isochrysis_galbana.AAC.3
MARSARAQVHRKEGAICGTMPMASGSGIWRRDHLDAWPPTQETRQGYGTPSHFLAPCVPSCGLWARALGLAEKESGVLSTKKGRCLQPPAEGVSGLFGASDPG